MDTSKTCFKCKCEKSRTQFYKHPRMNDGLLGKCKECTKKDVRNNRLQKVEYYREWDKRRSGTKRRIEAMNEHRKSWLARNGNKRHAHIILNNALRSGKVVKLPCEVCGSTSCIHGHHDDYSKPLEVQWLCAEHHSARHKVLKKASLAIQNQQ